MPGASTVTAKERVLRMRWEGYTAFYCPDKGRKEAPATSLESSAETAQYGHSMILIVTETMPPAGSRQTGRKDLEFNIRLWLCLELNRFQSEDIVNICFMESLWRRSYDEEMDTSRMDSDFKCVHAWMNVPSKSNKFESEIRKLMDSELKRFQFETYSIDLQLKSNDFKPIVRTRKCW